MLSAVRAGRVGAIILMGDDTTGGVSGTRAAVDRLQAAARAGHNPGLLVMTDQEGGEVARLPGPPDGSAAQMGGTSSASVYEQGVLTARMLRAAGVNVDLAPVADVTRIDGFMTREQRTFGSNPIAVAAHACAFARGLASQGVGYTLKDFPGLGDALHTTDAQPVRIDEPAPEIRADDAAYRDCGHGPLASVMVSSASYTHLTGDTPAFESPLIYRRVMRSDGISALTISDSLESGATDVLRAPARTAINAGLDMVMYPGLQSASARAYAALLAAARAGTLSTGRVYAAAARVLRLKRNLHLG
jgi:beta-N-acetylhexosaminidase